MTPEPAGVRTGRARWSAPRTRLLAVLGAAVLAVLVVLAVALTGGGDSSPSAAAGSSSVETTSGPAASSGPAGTSAPASTATSAAPTSAAPTSTTTGPVPGSADELPPALPQVPLTDTGAVGDGVTVDVVAVERFQGEATGPGNVSGPALRVSLRITNGTGEVLDVGAVSVNAGYGPDVTPAPSLDDVSRAPFSGTVAPDDAAEGRYVFSVPSGALDPVVLEVGYRPGAPLVLFVGPVV